LAQLFKAVLCQLNRPFSSIQYLYSLKMSF
jgi:hypothetical protein